MYSKLKYESGVHRVQRVPATETSGRVHTSTATVAIMPEVDDVDVKIDPKVKAHCESRYCDSPHETQHNLRVAQCSTSGRSAAT